MGEITTSDKEITEIFKYLFSELEKKRDINFQKHIIIDLEDWEEIKKKYLR